MSSLTSGPRPATTPEPGHVDQPADVMVASTDVPRRALCPTIGPSTLEPVDQITITILVDNSFDLLIPDTGPARRARKADIARVPASQYEDGTTVPGLRAEHGFCAMVAVRRGEKTQTLLMDTGITPDGMLVNADLLGVHLSAVEAVVLSHGHYDHTGGLAGLAHRHDSGLPLVLHPGAWSRRRILVPGQTPDALPTLSRTAIEAAGFRIVERRQPSLLLDGQVLVTGEIDRITEYEQGMPLHQAYRGGNWVPDPLILDDQAIVVHLRGRGLVVLTGCGHAGAVNIVRHALRLTGTDRLCALIGGLHLNGAAFEPVIKPTIAALTELAPELIVGAHCTGWNAQQQLAAAFPTAFVPNSVGTRYTLMAATGYGLNESFPASGWPVQP